MSSSTAIAWPLDTSRNACTTCHVAQQTRLDLHWDIQKPWYTSFYLILYSKNNNCNNQNQFFHDVWYKKTEKTAPDKWHYKKNKSYSEWKCESEDKSYVDKMDVMNLLYRRIPKQWRIGISKISIYHFDIDRIVHVTIGSFINIWILFQFINPKSA